MNILVTCGPAHEPIDQARRLTNFSTGRLGITLANALAAAGHTVHCFKGEGATWCEPLRVPSAQPFSTNDDLAVKLQSLAATTTVDLLFHAAALCDFRVEQVLNSGGEAITSRKFSTRGEGLCLMLAPTLKVLPRLRGWFPRARIVGWKYELEGTRDDAFARAWRQLRECDTDACVLNGSAYGDGFAFCTPPANVRECPALPDLVRLLVDWSASASGPRARQAE